MFPCLCFYWADKIARTLNFVMFTPRSVLCSPNFKLYLKILFPKPITSTPTCYSFAFIDFILQLKGLKFMKLCSYCDNFHLSYSAIRTKVIKSRNAEVDRRGFRIKQSFFPLFFLYVCISWQGQKASLHLRCWIVNILYSNVNSIDIFHLQWILY